MTDPFVPREKMYRKRRKHETQKDLSPAMKELEQARNKGRLYCKTCGKFKVWQKLAPRWNRRKKVATLSWHCYDCGDALLVKEYDLRKKKKGFTPLP